jgi:hypothetical protein
MFVLETRCLKLLKLWGTERNGEVPWGHSRQVIAGTLRWDWSRSRDYATLTWPPDRDIPVSGRAPPPIVFLAAARFFGGVTRRRACSRLGEALSAEFILP